jgi:hypothetical protein
MPTSIFVRACRPKSFRAIVGVQRSSAYRRPNLHFEKFVLAVTQA